jgi:hypothetical protein
MVKNKLLEEESKRIMKTNILKQEFKSYTVTAFSSHRNDQQSNRKRNEDISQFPYNCYTCGMRGHKRNNCRKQAKYKGNYRGDHHNGNIYSDNISMEVNMTERSSNQEGEMEREVSITRKRPQVEEEKPVYIQCLLRLPSKVCSSTTWVIDSGATDHLVKENTPVINKY